MLVRDDVTEYEVLTGADATLGYEIEKVVVSPVFPKNAERRITLLAALLLGLYMFRARNATLKSLKSNVFQVTESNVVKLALSASYALNMLDVGVGVLETRPVR